ncbi:MAG: YhfC family intramembrane metalloprotease [Oscillospiraceae bacterium]
MTATPMVSGSVIAALIVAAVLCLIIPIAALIFYKMRNRSVSVLSAVWGALGFFVFAMVLERLLHMVMLPIVQNNTWAYAFYGAFAAGIFEETARFLVFKTVMKKNTEPKDSIMYGIGHGGIESILVGSVNLITFAAIGILVNSVGIDEVLRITGATDEATIAIATAQIEGLTRQSVGMCFVSVLERVLAMIVHISLSVWVFRAAKEKGKVWLYPAAILAHAAVDFPAVLYQAGYFPLWVLYVFIAVCDVIVVIFAYKNFKSMKKHETI